MNVKDYIARINYTGSLEPNLKTLTALTWAHKTSVPFTNLEYVLKKGEVDFSLDKIYERVVHENCGGVCYQLNRLFTWLLEQLGFQVSILLGRFYEEITKEWSHWGGHNFTFVSILHFSDSFWVL